MVPAVIVDVEFCHIKMLAVEQTPFSTGFRCITAMGIQSCVMQSGLVKVPLHSIR